MKMKTAKQIKEELKKQGFDIKGVKIKVDSFYEFIWITIPDLELKNEIEKAVCNYTGLKPYDLHVNDC
jgi:hypothetical protein